MFDSLLLQISEFQILKKILRNPITSFSLAVTDMHNKT